MKLIADCGSTKTAWMLIGSDNDTECRSDGINPVRDDKATIGAVVTQQLLPTIASAQRTIKEVWFYGAGCIDPFKQSVCEVLSEAFPQASISVESDLLGAARALCGHKMGIACILGTGSNSCLYDGENMVGNVSPLGFILGDEGSGAVLGKMLVGDLLKGQLGEQLRDEFLSSTGLTPADIINNVYRKPQANRFLASLVPFIVRHNDDTRIHDLLINAFRAFFRRNVANYNHPELPVQFVGGIANQFQDELREAAAQEGFVVGQILKDPISRMADYHR